MFIRIDDIQNVAFKGTMRDIFIDQKEFIGPIYEQVNEAYRFVLRHINMGAEINGLYRSEEYELPTKAVREMIANAVVHRSYLDESCVQVCIFDDRIEVLSPGMLYGGLDIATAKMGKSRCRNEAIAEAFHYMHIIEAWGTGIPRLYNRSAKYGLPEPLFEEFGDGIKVTMFRKKNELQKSVDTLKKSVDAPENPVDAPKKSVDKKQKMDLSSLHQLILNQKYNEPTVRNIVSVYDAIKTDQVFSGKDIVAILGCSSSTAGEIMHKLRTMQVVVPVKGYGNGKYRFAYKSELEI